MLTLKTILEITKNPDLDEVRHKRFRIITLFLGALVIFCVHLVYIDRVYGISIFGDENGYWHNAAFFAGFRWHTMIPHSPYYSWGYSLLIAPFLYFFNNFETAFRAALVLNCVIVSCTFIMFYRFLRVSFSNINFWISILVAFVFSMHPAFAIHTKIGWTECLLIFLFTSSVLWMSTAKKNDKIWFFILGAFICIYALSVHNRMIGVVISMIMCVQLLAITKSIILKQYITYMVSLVVFYIMFLQVNGIVQANVWYAISDDNIGTFDGVLSAFFRYIPIIRMLNSSARQMFSVGSSTFILLFVGLVTCLWFVFLKIKKIRKDGFLKAFAQERDSGVTQVYILLSTVSTVLISSWFMGYGNDAQALYSRYIDPVIFMPAVYGAGFVLTNEQPGVRRNVIIMSAVLYALTAIATIIFFSINIHVTAFITWEVRYTSTVVPYIYVIRLINWVLQLSRPIIMLVLALFTMAVFAVISIRVKTLKLGIIGMLMILLVYSATNMRLLHDNHVQPNNSLDFYSSTAPFVAPIRDSTLPVFWLDPNDQGDWTYTFRRSALQSRLMDKEMPLISEDIPDKHYLSIVGVNNIFADNFTKKLIKSHENLALVEVTTNGANSAVLRIPNESFIESFFESEFSLSSQALLIDVGRYNINLSLQFEDFSDYGSLPEELGTVSIDINGISWIISMISEADITGSQIVLNRTLNVYNGVIAYIFNIDSSVGINDVNIVLTRIDTVPPELDEDGYNYTPFGLIEE